MKYVYIYVYICLIGHHLSSGCTSGAGSEWWKVRPGKCIGLIAWSWETLLFSFMQCGVLEASGPVEFHKLRHGLGYTVVLIYLLSTVLSRL